MKRGGMTMDEVNIKHVINMNDVRDPNVRIEAITTLIQILSQQANVGPKDAIVSLLFAASRIAVQFNSGASVETLGAAMENQLREIFTIEFEEYAKLEKAKADGAADLMNMQPVGRA